MFRRTKRGPRRAPYDWMMRLAGRLARRERLRDLSAPDAVLEAEERLVNEGLRQLTAGQALFVLRYQDELTRQFDRSSQGAPPGNPAEAS